MWTYYTVDIALGAVILIFIAIGFIKGFIDQIADLLSAAAAFVCAFLFTPVIAPVINDKIFYPRISAYASDALTKAVGGADLSTMFEDGRAAPLLKDLLGLFGADYDSIKAAFFEKISHSYEAAVANVTEKIASPVSYALAYAVCFLVLFVVVFIVVWVLTHALGLFSKKDELRRADRILGALLGAVTGVAVAWVLAIVLRMGLPYLQILKPSVFPDDLFERSYLFKAAYYINPLRKVVDLSYINKLFG
ncbi:MAG: CvpA family protein [Clostridia bacterium]|nr:CvpA family protein [Clostridia bacterium]